MDLPGGARCSPSNAGVHVKFANPPPKGGALHLTSTVDHTTDRNHLRAQPPSKWTLCVVIVPSLTVPEHTAPQHPPHQDTREVCRRTPRSSRAPRGTETASCPGESTPEHTGEDAVAATATLHSREQANTISASRGRGVQVLINLRKRSSKSDERQPSPRRSQAARAHLSPLLHHSQGLSRAAASRFRIYRRHALSILAPYRT